MRKEVQDSDDIDGGQKRGKLTSDARERKEKRDGKGRKTHLQGFHLEITPYQGSHRGAEGQRGAGGGEWWRMSQCGMRITRRN